MRGARDRMGLVHIRFGGCPGKGVRHQKPERPCGCFALLVSDTFSRRALNPNS